MIDYVRTKKPARVLLVTECSMADNVAAETTGTEFIRPCNFCPHMKRITLPKILDSLIHMRDEVLVDQALAARARASVQRMIDVG
jgi:quinolinate synthase